MQFRSGKIGWSGGVLDNPQADILIAPDIEAGNILAKGIVYFAQAYLAGAVVGARVPIILPSRSDTREAKLTAISMCVMIA